MGTSAGILTRESSTAARGVPKNAASVGCSVASEEQAGTDFSRSLSHLQGQEMVKPPGHFLAGFPLLPRSCAQTGGKTTLPGAPWYLPVSHPATLLGGLGSSRGFSPWNCPCAVTSGGGGGSDTQHFTHRPTLSLVVLQLGKGDFHGKGLGTSPVQCQQLRELALTCLTKPALGHTWQKPLEEKGRQMPG